MKDLVGILPYVYFYVCFWDPKNGKFLDERDFDDEPNPKFVLGLAENFSDIIVFAGWSNCGDFRLILRLNGKTVTDKFPF